MAEADDYWAPAFQLMLEEARRSIDRQSERVQTVRERSIALVGFGSIVAAGLGLTGDDGLGITGGGAVAAFVVVALAALYVLVPRKFLFELSARRMERWLDDPAMVDLNHLVLTTAIRHDEHHASNHGQLQRFQIAITIGVAALLVESLALVTRLVV